LKSLIDTCWFVFKWGLLAALLAAVSLALYFYSRVNDEIRQRVQAKWQAHYPNLVVTVRSAQLGPDGIEIRGLTLLDPHASGPQAELANIDEIMLECQTSLPELMQGEPKFSRAVVHRPIIHATRRPEGGWSAAQLFPLPKFSKRPIPITVEDGTLEFFDPLKNPTSTFTLRNINLATKLLASSEPAGEPNIEVRGDLAGDHFQHIEVAGTFGPGFKGFDINGVLTGLDVSPGLRNALPSEVAERISALAPLHGQAQLGFHFRDQPGGPTPLEFKVKGSLSGARFDDPRLPSPVTNLEIDFRADNRGIVVDRMEAQVGDAAIKAAGHIDGFAPGAPFKIDAHARGLLLGRRWEPILPPLLLETWHKFLPAGVVNADLAVEFDGRTYRPDLNVQFLNLSVTYHRFPYRLDRVTGWMTLKGKHLETEVVGYGGSQPVHVAGKFDNPGERFTGEIEIDGKNQRFDKNLWDALAVFCVKVNHPETCRTLQSLNPDGSFDFVMHSRRDSPDVPMAPHLTVTLNRASVRYEKFPYPISNIRGTLEQKGSHWTFYGLEGTNGPGTIHCDGTLDPAENGSELKLHFSALHVPLQDDLRDALNPQAQRVWNNLRPQGAINVEAVDLRFLSATKAHDLSFRVQPDNATMSIEPVMFPYRLERLQGALNYSRTIDHPEGHFDLEGIKAVHGRTPVRTAGFCDFDRDGNWHLQLNQLAADQVRADDGDLVSALSRRLKKCVRSLNPKGAINIAGTLDFYGGPDPNTAARSGWNVLFNIHQGTIGNAIRIDNINGNIRLIGGCDGEHAHSGGMLDIDSLTFKDFQFTLVQGPLWIDDKQVVFGSAAEQPQLGQPPHHITARFYGGFVQADCGVVLADTPRYSLQARLDDADLKRFAHETVPGKQRIDGRVLATVNLTGETSGVHSLRGFGEVRLTQADIYQVAFMGRLLKLLNFKPPDSTAFTNSTIQYHIEGDHAYLDKVAFVGDAISLEGAGDMGFDSSIKLTLHPILGRSDWELPVFRTVMGATSRQFVQVHVTGTLADPQMSKEVLPAVGKAIERMQDNAPR
jgi:hypothetical protein